MLSLLKLLAIIVAVYIVFLIYLSLTQRSMIYFPDNRKPEPPMWQAADMQTVTLPTEDGLKLNAWYKPAQKQQTTIVYFHGNAGHIGYRVPLVRQYLNHGIGVLLVSYRGYAGNPGKPSEQGLYRDGRAAIAYLQRQGVARQCQVLYGESIGAAVALKMANEISVGAVILQSPFTSIAAMTHHHYRFIPQFLVARLLRDKFNNDEMIATLTTPLLVLHGEKDRIVPFEMAKQLFLLAPRGKIKELKIYPQRGHNDLFHQSLVDDVLMFIKKTSTHYVKNYSVVRCSFKKRNKARLVS